MSKTLFSNAAGLHTVRFASEEARDAAEEAGLVYASFTNINPSSDAGYTVPDVNKANKQADEIAHAMDTEPVE